ncbi:hypothetical protein HD554DRAFT_2018521, partial [Boletus coccyginus]
LTGNVIGIGARNPWQTYTMWVAEYGETFYTQLLGLDIMINLDRVAHDLLGGRSYNYSSYARPFLSLLYPSVRSLFVRLGTEFSPIFLPYGDRRSLHRRLFHQAFHMNEAIAFRPAQMKKAHELMMNLTTTILLSASLIMVIAYGYWPHLGNDLIITHVETAIEIAMKMVRPKGGCVECFPSVFFFVICGAPVVENRHIPKSLPGF